MPVILGSPYFSAVDEDTMLGRASGVVWDANGYDRTYQRRWRVRTVNPDVGPQFILLNAPFLPLPFAPYIGPNSVEYDTNALAVKADVKQDPDAGDAWHQYLVTVDYSTKMPEGGPIGWVTFGDDISNKPWLRKPALRWESENVVVAADRDLDGKPYHNSARMFFKPSPTVNRSRAVLTVKRFERRVDADLVTRYTNAVNLNTFLGRPPGGIQLMTLTADQDYYGPTEFYRVTYRFRFARKLPDGTYESLQPQFWDAGTHRLQPNALVPFASMPVPIWRNGHPVTDPVILDGNGQELKPNPTSGKFDFTNSRISFREYPSEALELVLTSGLGSP